MAKRGQNEGSIRKRKDGTWEARVTIGISADGKQQRKSLYGKTRQEVSAKMTDLLNNLQKGIITNPTEMTLAEWLDFYMLEYKKQYVKPTTYNNYTVKVKNHIKPAIGHYKLKALRQDIIQKFVNSLSGKGLAPSTVIDIFKVLSNALETAVDDGLIVRNVANRVKLPKTTKPQITVLTQEQQNAFVEQAKVTYMGVVYIFDLCTGMRLGELLGLKWQDIDFEQNQLHIKRIIRKVKDPDNPEEHWHLEFGTPKTPTSERIIPLNETAIKVLADVWEQQEKNKEKANTAYEDNDLVFCTQLGRPLDPNNIRRTCYSICAKIGVSNIHPHCLRHTFATRGAENNVDVRVMQKFLGHATIKETADTYTHVLNDLKQSEILKLDKAVNY
ncbi:MAG: site-specific integrase [Lachnospiraceae bacterium]